MLPNLPAFQFYQKTAHNSKVYHLLTGATGLLGGYLIRDLLLSGHRLAVLARPSRKESARERIETILLGHEQRTGKVLPRPVVIEGDLTDDSWHAGQLDWLSRHCQSLIHCGASLVFYEDVNGEPWKTNIQGTRHILDLCRATGIRTLHHFSTAYVAGSYRDPFYENMLDVKQELRNDYEKSKFESEQMVRNADYINSLTVYRPSIVVGDSVSAYTSAYHGYYAVLKLAHTLVNRLKLGETSGRRLLLSLGMTGNEYKNFVPVDWVSAVVTHIFTHSELHGKTYHLTNPSPTSILEMVDTIQEVVEHYSDLVTGETDTQHKNEDWFKANYAESITTYRDYLNDDPHFISGNTISAAPHFLCPKVDSKMLHKMGHFAIKNQFGKRPPKPFRPHFNVSEHIQHFAHRVTKVNGNFAGSRRFSLRAVGPGGGEWTFFVGRDGYFFEEGICSDCHEHFDLSVDELMNSIHENSGAANGLTQLLNKLS